MQVEKVQVHVIHALDNALCAEHAHSDAMRGMMLSQMWRHVVNGMWPLGCTCLE